MHGFGPVEREENEPYFHQRWEAQVFAMRRAAMAQGLYNIDESRYAIERMDPARYLAASYYERWLASLELLLVEKGIVTPEELETRTAQLREHPEAPLPQRDDPKLVEQVLGGGATVGLPRPQPAHDCRFSPGDRVRTRNMHPRGHTRLPRYARGKVGVIDRVHGIFPFPDTNAQGLGPQPQVVYSVRFDNTELWGDAADGPGYVYLDLWESYLEPA
jgi:nitrile hydratase